MKHFKNFREYPFITALIVSSLLLTLIGYMGKNNVYAGYSVDLWKVPQLAVVLEGVKDGNYPWKIAGPGEEDTVGSNSPDYKGISGEKGTEGMPGESETGSGSTMDNNKTDNSNTDSINTDNSTSDIGEAVNSGPGENSGNGSVSGKPSDTEGGNGTETVVTGKDNTEKGNSEKGNSEKGNMEKGNTEKDNSEKGGTASGNVNKGENSSDTEKTSGSNDHEKPSDTGPDKNQNGGESSYQFEKVEKSYFDNALFIGDSRTVGLSEYSGWDNPTYYADVGLTIYDVFDKEIAEADGKKTTLDKALEQQSFTKIYIMLGINELGRGTTETFIEEYKKAVEKLQKLQPDAIIFVEGIMKVSKKKSDSDPIFNNKNIKEKNDHLALLADNKDIFYIDVNEAITDKTGGIPEKYTFDNIHLKAAYYSIWTDFLLKHGVVKEE